MKIKSLMSVIVLGLSLCVGQFALADSDSSDSGSGSSALSPPGEKSTGYGSPSNTEESSGDQHEPTGNSISPNTGGTVGSGASGSGAPGNALGTR